MAQTPLESVVAHWYKLFENFQTSARDFYGTVEIALNARKIPGLKVSRVKWSEGGVLSPDREYLRVEGDRHTFDVCAAPFGTGVFFSSWTVKKQARFVLLYLLALGAATLVSARVIQWAMNWLYRLPYVFLVLGIVGNPFVLYPLAFLISLWGVAILARMGGAGAELAVLRLPLIGWLYKSLFARETYYRIDTLLMFQSAVHAALMEAIEGQTTQKGIRGLTEDERRPVFHKLM